jgi:non-homologous end joining protein Ku
VLSEFNSFAGYAVPRNLARSTLPPKASWKGFLKIAEVTCPVAVYVGASTGERVALHTINRPRQPAQRAKTVNLLQALRESAGASASNRPAASCRPRTKTPAKKDTGRSKAGPAGSRRKAG